jgi:hypothetical protein
LRISIDQPKNIDDFVDRPITLALDDHASPFGISVCGNLHADYGEAAAPAAAKQKLKPRMDLGLAVDLLQWPFGNRPPGCLVPRAGKSHS